ncbi:MAG: glycoside hydrolase, partial [Proteobacteria bacterium]|nr:glycoside hydrolase [Pseudomonadota bacterium]
LTHCPRLAMVGETLHLLDANGRLVYLSLDEGRTWDGPNQTGISPVHTMFDRPLELPDGSLLSTGHCHRGTTALPNLRQAPAEQMVYRSTDQGRTYAPLSVLSCGRYLVLCEGSMARLADGRIAALLRENSFVYEPMYLCLSADEGRTWTEPEPTPLVGHRPTLGLTASGKLLVTYRDVGPDAGTAAWMGTLEGLTGPYLVHGRTSPDRWALRPLTDATSATADLTVEVTAGEAPCAVHLGAWWRILRGRIEVRPPSIAGSKPRKRWRKLTEDQWNTLRFSYAAGRITLRVNGRKRLEIEVDPQAATTRAILFGAAPVDKGDATSDISSWRRASLHIEEPRMVREYDWQWNASQGLPHAEQKRQVLELDNDREAHFGDFGYSGWVQLPDGRFFCAYHHGGGGELGYEPSHSAHVRGAWFSEDDFA